MGRFCHHCLAPFEGDTRADHQVPACGTIPRLDAGRTPACRYIEKLRRAAEDLDTAAMGLSTGSMLGGTHLTAPTEFAEDARRRYEAFGEYTLPEEAPVP